MVVQFCVPGWHTVTVVKILLKYPPCCPSGPKPTVTATELFVAGVGVVAVVLELLPPQPTHPSTEITESRKGTAVAFDRNLEFNAPPPLKRYWEQGRARTLCPHTSACGKSWSIRNHSF